MSVSELGLWLMRGIWIQQCRRDCRSQYGWIVLYRGRALIGDVSLMAVHGNFNNHVMAAFSIMRVIVIVGWSVYALSCVFGAS